MRWVLEAFFAAGGRPPGCLVHRTGRAVGISARFFSLALFGILSHVVNCLLTLCLILSLIFLSLVSYPYPSTLYLILESYLSILCFTVTSAP